MNVWFDEGIAGIKVKIVAVLGLKNPWWDVLWEEKKNQYKLQNGEKNADALHPINGKVKLFAALCTSSSCSTSEKV